MSRTVLKRKFFDIIYPGGYEDYKDILDVARKLKPAAIWLGYGNISYPLLKYLKENSNYPIVLDTDSVWSRFVLRGLPFAKNESEIDKIRQKGKAKDGGDRIRPGSAKGHAYCARSAKIKKCKKPPCANALSRKKWKCRGKRSMK